MVKKPNLKSWALGDGLWSKTSQKTPESDVKIKSIKPMVFKCGHGVGTRLRTPT